MSISIREYIKWGTEEASEPTTTLVLTSPEKRFVDIRVLKTANKDQQHESNDQIGADLLHFDSLDWAFAGTSTSEIRRTDNNESHIHSAWHHWVSSRTANVDGVVDEGDMVPRPNSRTLETGSMVNPASGNMTDYEEVWIDEDPIATGHEEDGVEKKVCVVLVLHDEANQARGMVVQVGQYCQGVLRVGEHFSLERWAWEQEKGWRREVRMGDLWLPCGAVLEGYRATLGGELQYGEYLWKVVEFAEL